MPRRKKQYIDRQKSFSVVTHDETPTGHPVIPVGYALGFVRAMLEKWSIGQKERERLEPLLLDSLLVHCENRLLRQYDQDTSPGKTFSVLRAYARTRDIIEHLHYRSCPLPILEAQAQVVDDSFQEKCFPPRWTVKNREHRLLLLKEILQKIQSTILRESACKMTEAHPHPTTMPNDQTLRDWIERPSGSGLLEGLPNFQIRNEILAYYHGLSAESVKNMLKGSKRNPVKAPK